jgi:prepilin-type N-terminal cleavage/methylation domain-containing protein
VAGAGRGRLTATFIFYFRTSPLSGAVTTMPKAVNFGRCLARGFTLIELLVVIIIIAVVSSILVPNYTRMSAKMQFDGTASEVEDLFSYAHEQAITSDTTVSLSYDAQREVFTVTSMPVPAAKDLPVAMTNNENHQSNQPVPTRMVALNSTYGVRQFSIGSGNGLTGQSGGSMLQGGAGPTVHFHGDGTCDGAELILFSRHDGYTADLRIMPANGRLVRADE